VFVSERRWKVHEKAVTTLAFAAGGQELSSIVEHGRACVYRLSVVHPLQQMAEDIYDCSAWGWSCGGDACRRCVGASCGSADGAVAGGN